MKKIISAIVSLLVFASIQVHSQEAKSLRLSFVAEPQISWLKPDIDGVESRGNKAGYNFGVVMDRFFAENYAFSTGLTINTTGGKLRYAENGDERDMEYQLRYIEVPLGLKLRSNDFRRTNFYGRFGLTPQINIDARDDQDKTIGEQVRFFDLAYHLGAGLEYSIGGSNALMFGLVYH
ncbi:MAG: porin family protein, partial [Marinilabiliaceae bacterium]